MRDHYGHRNWHRSDDHHHGRGDDDEHPDRQFGSAQHHHNSYYRDDSEPRTHHHACRNSHSDDDNRDHPQGRHLKLDSEGADANHGDGAGPSMPPHEGGDLGWDMAAWDDAGGFDAVLFGHLSESLGHNGNVPPIIVVAIEDLNVEFNILTQIQNTLVFLDASNGGSIDIGSGVNANGLQLGSIDHSVGISSVPDIS